MEFTLKIGVMPGRILEYTFATPITVREALEVAKNDFANAQGNVVESYLGGSGSYAAKLDGTAVTLDTPITAEANALIISRNIKGN